MGGQERGEGILPGDLDAIVDPDTNKKLKNGGISPFEAEVLHHEHKDDPRITKRFRPTDNQFHRLVRSLRGQSASEIAGQDDISTQAVRADIDIAVRKLSMLSRAMRWLRRR